MKKAALFLPIISGIMFGSVGIFVRTLYAAGFNNPTVIFARTVFASVILFAYIFIRDKSLFRVKKSDVVWILCCALLGMLATNLCFNVSSTNLSLAFAAVLLSIAPVYTLIISRIVFGLKITGRKMICALMTIAGCVLVSGIIGSDVHLSAVGLVAGIATGISYGLYSIFSKKGTEGGLRGLTITFYCMVVISIVLLFFTDYGTIGSYIAESPVSHILFLIAHSLCVGVIPYLFLTISMEYITPGTATILASCEPVAAMIFGVLFFQEIPTVLSLCGLMITVIALLFLCKE